MTSTVRVVAGCCVDGAALIAACAAVHENAATIATFRLLAARDSSSALGRMPPELLDRVEYWTIGRAIASARGRLDSLVGDIETIEARPYIRVLNRFGLRLIVQGPSSHREMLLEAAGEGCDCEECGGGVPPTITELLDARRFFMTIRLASTDKLEQSRAQSSSLESMEDSIDDQNCYAPCASFEVGPIRFSDTELRRYRRAVELLRLRTPSEAMQVRPISGKAPADGSRKSGGKGVAQIRTMTQRRVSFTPKIFVLHNVRARLQGSLMNWQACINY